MTLCMPIDFVHVHDWYGKIISNILPHIYFIISLYSEENTFFLWRKVCMYSEEKTFFPGNMSHNNLYACQYRERCCSAAFLLMLLKAKKFFF